MAAPETGQRQYSFGEFTLDVDRGALRRGSEEVRLRRQSFDVLRYLVEQHGRLVTKGELLESVWGDTVVTDGSLTQCLIDVRRAIGDHTRQTIRTLPRRGYIFEAPVTEGGDSTGATIPGPAATPHATRNPWSLAAGAILLLAAAIAWWLLPFDSRSDTNRAARADYIAVLPFVDMSEGQSHGYLSDGISEEILNLLAESPDLLVIARTSSFSFRDEADIATIAEELGVAYVLQGSVRRSDDRIRVTSQLIDTATNTPVWSNSYDRELGDVLVLQLDIAAAVATALQVTLSPDPPSRDAGPGNAEAYERYLQGRLFHNRRAPGDPRRAEEYFRQAVEIDRTYGQAWAGLAGAYFIQMIDGERDGSLAAWQEAVEQALRHAPKDPEVQMRAAQFYWNNGERDRARQHLRQATMLGPNNPLVLAAWAFSNVFHGQIDEGIARQRQVVALDPLGAIDHSNLAGMLLGAGRFEEALAEGRKALDLNPAYTADFGRLAAEILILQERFGEALGLVRPWPAGEYRDTALAMLYHGLGRSGDANTALERLVATPGADAACGAAEVHAYRGDVDQSFAWLQTCLERTHAYGREGRVVNARLSRFLHALHDDPRWERLLAHSH